MTRGGALTLPFVVAGIIGILVIPVSAFWLDLLLVGSIGIAFIVLMITLNIKDPLEFGAFPGLILILTLLRLSLNVSSTRLIIGEGEAGSVIQAFGEFVVGGNIVLGLIIFCILLIIQFVVITKGAGRIAEVAARFTLDAMPGHQMAIDADLNAGLIDEKQARQRRERIALTANFYGAMDGSSKFVKGDAVAAMLITGINLIGGLIIGMMQRGMSLSEAASTYTVLTVGDGLITMIPSLLVSTAAGVIVSTSANKQAIGGAVMDQLLRQPAAIWMASGVCAVFAFIPGLPTIPFLFLAGGFALFARGSEGYVAQQQEEELLEDDAPPAETEAGPTESPPQDIVQVDPLALELGIELVKLDPKGGEIINDRIKTLRATLAAELGVVMPYVHTVDNSALGSKEYLILLRGHEVARGEVIPGKLLALDEDGYIVKEVEGIPARDPAYNYPGLWIPEEARIEAESNGYTVVEPLTVVMKHFEEAMKANAADLLGRQETQDLLDRIKQSYPALVQGVVPDRLSLGTIHRVLQKLLKEGVPIRDMTTILECLADHAEQHKDPIVLTEYVRQALSKQISRLLENEEGEIHGIQIGPRMEALVIRLFSSQPQIDPDQVARQMRQLQSLVETKQKEQRLDRPPPLFTSSSVRPYVRKLIEPVLPQLPVVAVDEIPSQVSMVILAEWELEDAVAQNLSLASANA